MIEVEITKEIIEEATRRSDYKDNLTNSIRNGDGIFVGEIGEIIFANLLKENNIDHTIEKTYDYDLIVGRRTFDIKTKDRTVKPLDYYECSINAETYKQKAEYLAFVSLNLSENKGYILGVSNKFYYMKNATFVPRWSIDPSNGFKAHTDMWNLPIKKLGSIEHFLQIAIDGKYTSS